MEMQVAKNWFAYKKWKPHPFQKQTWQYIAEGYSGMLNAPTGYGKTYAIWFGVLQDFLTRTKNEKKTPKGLHCLWITPLRALSKEIENAAKAVSEDLNLPYTIGLRTGDTTAKEKAAHKKQMPHALITTPESMHLMLAQKEYGETFRNLQFVIVDEWHELLGSKRGVQVELALSRLRAINPALKVWGISATIGNLKEAKDILLGEESDKGIMVKADIEKKIQIETVLPDTLEKFPWAGHLGLKLGNKVLDIIRKSNSTLVFTNTRFQAETWYRHLLDLEPNLAGLLALHHGSLGEDTRKWVEAALHDGKLKAVVCTSSLDLGVDFRPVDTVVQVGSPKGIARFMQRAGRSGHQPGATSKIYFVPTHSLEIIEGSAMRYAVKNNKVEDRIPYIRSFDVLIQYLVTLAISDGFKPEEIFQEVKQTHCYQSITWDEFAWCLAFITTGGKSLYAYDEFHKVIIENGIYKVTNRRIAMQHRLSMGTIVSSGMLQIKFVTGKYLGTIEEWFISRLKPGDVFWFAGKNLEYVRIKDMTVQVRASASNKGIIPSWQGGKMPLSTQLAATIRHQLNEYEKGNIQDKELKFLAPLLEEQKRRSVMPNEQQLLIEKMKTREGCHVFVYPFEGRFVHEGMAAIMANRIALFKPITFSIAMNDYGFELLSDQDIPIEEAVDSDLFTTSHLNDDIIKSVNTTEMAKRRFRDIASIAGLVFTGFPGKQVKTKHLQASSKLFFSVFEDYEKDNLLLKEAYDELYDFQLEIVRLRNAFERIEKQEIIVKNLERFSPFSFPIFTERWREKFSNEDIETRVQRIKAQMEKA
ncbi:MAG TPA: ligase-associated DNA damage response DEXH box helicase [Bacteroidia bacterium]|jgi:ATP-dependent Lhr-like helicase|nr:ligase-associated DNA damage response DEXH box helicase [Bacteroidia bacterium]